MRKLVSTVVLMVASLPAMALPNPVNVPEPESLALFAIGAAALMIARRRK